MSTDSLLKHYGENYFASHYGRQIVDKNYRRLLSEYWCYVLKRHVSHLRCNGKKSLLDYGAGSGAVSEAFQNTACFDRSIWALEFLSMVGRTVYTKREDIPKQTFSTLLCSHSLEHYEDPKSARGDFRELVEADGKLILILPVERSFKVRLEPDADQHLYCWNFQTISNLLRISGWKPVSANIVYGPFGLGALNKFIPFRCAIRIAAGMGRIRESFESMLVVAAKD